MVHYWYYNVRDSSARFSYDLLWSQTIDNGTTHLFYFLYALVKFEINSFGID